MTKTVLTTLSLSFLTLAAAAPSPASEQSGARHFTSTPIESARVDCSAQAEIDLGWEYQQQLIAAGLAARSSEALSVPGAIISPPFPSFAPYRAEVPSARVVGKTSKPSRGASRSRGVAAAKS